MYFTQYQREAAKEIIPAMPFDVCGAMSQGYIGCHIQPRQGHRRAQGQDRDENHVHVNNLKRYKLHRQVQETSPVSGIARRKGEDSFFLFWRMKIWPCSK